MLVGSKPVSEEGVSTWGMGGINETQLKNGLKGKVNIQDMGIRGSTIHWLEHGLKGGVSIREKGRDSV